MRRSHTFITVELGEIIGNDGQQYWQESDYFQHSQRTMRLDELEAGIF